MDQPKPKSKHPKIVTEIDDFGRKKFTLQQNDSSDREGEEKQKKFIDTGKYASTLIGREQKIDTDKYIGKIEGTKKKKKTEVFYCEVCEVGFKCDLAYITHINSPAHNRKLGMNMKVEAVSVETVASKLARMAQEKCKPKHEKMMQKKLGKNWQSELLNKQKQATPSNDVIKKVLEMKKEKEQFVKKTVAENQGKQPHAESAEEEEEVEDEDEQMMKSLGLPTSFGSKKKKY